MFKAGYTFGMAKNVTRFICANCGAVQSKWMGKCPDCGSWDSLEQQKSIGGGASQDQPMGVAAPLAGAAPKAMPIDAPELVEGTDGPDALLRMPTGIGELDRVLGGSIESDGQNKLIKGSKGSRGLVPGSAILIGGDPGIGKSTLLLQAANGLAMGHSRVLYVSSEESAHQLRLRAKRLGAAGQDKVKAQGDATTSELYVLADTNLARIIDQTIKTKPAVLIVDSIQMIYKGDLPAAPGSVTQLRACCQELVYLAKTTGCAIILIGHVTKEGRLAGPRLLEHMVDTVLYFEGDRYHSHRVVRAIKNRFGTTLEVGLFEMTDRGLLPVEDGAGLLAAEYQPMAGSVVCPVVQGSRCLLIEIQALTATGFLGNAKRKTSGLDSNRLAMLIAVLEKRAELKLADQDIFTSSVGGMKVSEPAADLAVALAIASAHYNRQLAPGVCAVGEIGLGGEIRHVQQMEQRIREAARMGFKQVIAPKIKIKVPSGCELIECRNVDQAVQLLG